MKKLLIALTALALTATAASAQTTTAPAAATDASHHGRYRQLSKAGKKAKSPAQQADRRAARMAQALSLSADQEAKVEGIFLAQNQEMKALKARYAGNTDRQALRPEIQALRAKYDNQLQTALGADAYARYDKLRDERHDKIKQARGPKEGKTKLKVKS